MKFQPQVLSPCNHESPLGDIIPGNIDLSIIRFHYHLGVVPLEYADSEIDLGILINPNLNFTDQHDALLSEANQNVGLLKRTCHLVNDIIIKRKRALLLIQPA